MAARRSLKGIGPAIELGHDPARIIDVLERLDNGAVIQALKDINYSGWVMAELDSWSDPYEGAARSHAFLKQHFA